MFSFGLGGLTEMVFFLEFFWAYKMQDWRFSAENALLR